MKRAAPCVPQARRNIRMIEFFSGIGGMRCALERALEESTSSSLRGTDEHPQLESCTAYEISEKANDVYRYNFDFAKNNEKTANGGNGTDFCVRTKLVEQLKLQDLPANTNLWTMSPPCQPFTRTRMAKQRDLEDKRTAGFLAIMNLLKQMEEPSRPTWILLENVEGFVGSDAHKLFHETLLQTGYSWRDGLLSPIQIGIPNHRNRYYALCEKSDRFFSRSSRQKGGPPTDEDNIHESSSRNLKVDLQMGDFPVQNLSNFVSHNIDTTELIIPETKLSKDWAQYLPVVSHLDTQSHCFTAAYSRQLHRATGSLLLMDEKRTESVEKCPIDRSNMKLLKLRRFSAEELLNLFGFPKSFAFPQNVDIVYQYKLIGNSISVFVVKELMKHLVVDP